MVQAEVEAWPQTEAEHQAALTALLTTGRLRQAWRELKAGYKLAGDEDKTRWEMVQITHILHSRPVAEIPSYAVIAAPLAINWSACRWRNGAH